VLAPFSTDKADIPDDVYALGTVTPIAANGSVARISLSPDLGRTIKAILRTERFDIMHLHEPLMPAVPWLVLRSSNVPNIATFHAFGDYSTFYAMGRPILRPFFNRITGRIAVSSSAFDFVSQYFEGEYEIIPNGVDVQRFGAHQEPVGWMRDGRPTILFVGRFDEHRKGLRWILQALPLVEPYFPDLRVVVAGKGDPEAVAEWLPLRDYTRPNRTIYRSAGSALEVEFVGFVSPDDLPRYYQSADVYCAPSTGGESFGIVLLEAMAAGTPVLASRIPGYAAVLTHGREGFLTEPKNPPALAAGLIRLLSDPTLRAQMAEAGRRTSRSYDWPIITERIVGYYERIRTSYSVAKKGRRWPARARATNSA
jgi:phosphatidylinositol alpha-mannosyltransferase